MSNLHPFQTEGFSGMWTAVTRNTGGTTRREKATSKREKNSTLQAFTERYSGMWELTNENREDVLRLSDAPYLQLNALSGRTLGSVVDSTYVFNQKSTLLRAAGTGSDPNYINPDLNGCTYQSNGMCGTLNVVNDAIGPCEAMCNENTSCTGFTYVIDAGAGKCYFKSGKAVPAPDSRGISIDSYMRQKTFLPQPMSFDQYMGKDGTLTNLLDGQGGSEIAGGGGLTYNTSTRQITGLTQDNVYELRYVFQPNQNTNVFAGFYVLMDGELKELQYTQGRGSAADATLIYRPPADGLPVVFAIRGEGSIPAYSVTITRASFAKGPLPPLPPNFPDVPPASCTDFWKSSFRFDQQFFIKRDFSSVAVPDDANGNNLPAFIEPVTSGEFAGSFLQNYVLRAQLNLSTLGLGDGVGVYGTDNLPGAFGQGYDNTYQVTHPLAAFQCKGLKKVNSISISGSAGCTNNYVVMLKALRPESGIDDSKKIGQVRNGLVLRWERQNFGFQTSDPSLCDNLECALLVLVLCVPIGLNDIDKPKLYDVKLELELETPAENMKAVQDNVIMW